jgi:hypothetical protein
MNRAEFQRRLGRNRTISIDQLSLLTHLPDDHSYRLCLPIIYWTSHLLGTLSSYSPHAPEDRTGPNLRCSHIVVAANVIFMLLDSSRFPLTRPCPQAGIGP